MGSCKSKSLVDENPAIVAGSTVISGRSVMILGDSILMPMRDTESNESSVVEIDLKQRNVKVLRGISGSLTAKFVNNSRRHKDIRQNAFLDVDEGEMREESFQL